MRKSHCRFFSINKTPSSSPLLTLSGLRGGIVELFRRRMISFRRELSLHARSRRLLSTHAKKSVGKQKKATKPSVSEAKKNQKMKKNLPLTRKIALLF